MKDNTGVSPVIGTFFLIALTILTTSVISVYTLGFINNLDTKYTVILTAHQTGTNTVDITYHGISNAPMINYIDVNIEGDEYTRWCDDTVAVDSGGSDWLPAFGSNDGIPVPCGTLIVLEEVLVSGSQTISITSGFDNLIATATFMDGSQQVVLDTYV